MGSVTALVCIQGRDTYSLPFCLSKGWGRFKVLFYVRRYWLCLQISPNPIYTWGEVGYPSVWMREIVWFLKSSSGIPTWSPFYLAFKQTSKDSTQHKIQYFLFDQGLGLSISGISTLLLFRVR